MSKLFSPILVDAVELSHRVAFAPLRRLRAGLAGDVPNDLMPTYNGQRAAQGGLTVTEATFGLPQAGRIGVFTSSCHSSTERTTRRPQRPRDPFVNFSQQRMQPTCDFYLALRQ
jgi:2,4-dienoyl-CoA reductase-like NADH-dependent reductase (Old Yellow Enzyme family)